MDADLYVNSIRADSDRLAGIAARDLQAAVPCCPGWTVRDLVMHLATVYLHKTARTQLMRDPEPWPPTSPDDPIGWFLAARDEMVELFSRLGPNAPSYTWHPADQTVGFWLRRMAIETAVHTGDIESVRGTRSPINPALARAGVDEALEVVLAGDWSDDPQPGDSHRVRLVSGDRVRLVSLEPERVSVDRDPPASTPDEGLVTASPSDMLLWLWRRLPDGAVERGGNLAAVARLHDWMAVATT